MPLYARLAAIFTLCHRLLEIADPVLEQKVHTAVNEMLESLDAMLGDVLGDKSEIIGNASSVGLFGSSAETDLGSPELYTIPPHIFQKMVETAKDMDTSPSEQVGFSTNRDFSEGVGK